MAQLRTGRLDVASPTGLRTVGILLLLLLAVAAVFLLTTTSARSAALGALDRNTLYLRDDITSLYRSAADADATATAAFLTTGGEPSDLHERYEGDLAEFSRTIAAASSHAGARPETVERLSGIGDRLARYVDLVARAQAADRAGLPLGSAYLQEASESMQRSVLPQIQALGSVVDRELHLEYDAAGDLPEGLVVALAAATLGLVVSYGALMVTTHRYTPESLVAVLVVLIVVPWWAISFGTYTEQLALSRQRAETVVVALGPAQVAALQARSIEALALAAPVRGDPEADFRTRTQLLLRERPPGTVVGGALGAALRQVAGTSDEPLVADAVTKARAYFGAHERLRSALEQGRYDEAVATATGSGGADSPATARQLADSLTLARTTVGLGARLELSAAEATEAGHEPVLLAALAIAAGGVVLGTRRRLRSMFAGWLPGTTEVRP